MKKYVMTALLCAFLLCSCEEAPPSFYIKGELPDIGEYSAKNTAGRFYSEYTPEFVPSDEYGTVIPYVGSAKDFYTEWGYSEMYADMGFCTPDGKIISDANGRYSNIRLERTDDGFEYYSVYIYPQNEQDYAGNSIIIPVSGKWMLNMGSGMWNAGEGIISNVDWTYDEDGSHAKTICYNYDGELLFELDGYSSYGAFSHGLLPVSIYDNQLNIQKAGYINTKGEIVIDGYCHCNEFNSEGTAYVTPDNEQYYLINTKGERISDIYTNMYSTGDGYYRADNNNSCELLDAKGNLIATANGVKYADFTVLENGEIVYTDYHTVNRCSDGSLITCKESGYPAKAVIGKSLFVCSRGEGVKKYPKTLNASVEYSYIVDYDGNTVLKFEDNNSYSHFLTNDGLFIYSGNDMLVKSEDEVEDRFYTRGININTGKEVFSYDKSGYAYSVDTDGKYIKIGLTDNKGNTSLSLYSTEKGEFVLENCSVIEYYEVNGNKYFTAAADKLCTLYDENLRIIYQTINE